MKLIIIMSLLSLSLISCGGHIRTPDGKCLTCRNDILTGEPANYDINKEKSMAEYSKNKKNFSDQRITERKLTPDKYGLPYNYQFTASTKKNINQIFEEIRIEYGFYDNREREFSPKPVHSEHARVSKYAISKDKFYRVAKRNQVYIKPNYYKVIAKIDVVLKVEEKDKDTTKFSMVVSYDDNRFKNNTYSDEFKSYLIKSLSKILFY